MLFLFADLLTSFPIINSNYAFFETLDAKISIASRSIINDTTGEKNEGLDVPVPWLPMGSSFRCMETHIFF